MDHYFMMVLRPVFIETMAAVLICRGHGHVSRLVGIFHLIALFFLLTLPHKINDIIQILCLLK